jgi:hypothetical protein
MIFYETQTEKSASYKLKGRSLNYWKTIVFLHFIALNFYTVILP